MSPPKEPEVNLELAVAHGLSESEWEQILGILGRTPTYSEHATCLCFHSVNLNPLLRHL